MSTSEGQGMRGRDRDGGQPHVVPPDRSFLTLGLSLVLEILSTLDDWYCSFAMIKLVDITYSEHLNLCLSLSP